MIKKIISILLLVIVFVALAGFILVNRLSNRAVPSYNGEFVVPGLLEEVVVYRDSFAIPHIYAENQHDLYFTTGYIMAQERLWQMDLLRRVTLGRLSEIFGESYMDTDQLLRALDYSKKSKHILRSTDPEITDALDAFANGINAYITTNAGKLPFEFAVLDYKPELWKPFHSLNLIGYMAWDLKAGWSQTILEQIKPHIDSARFFDLIPDITTRDEVVFSRSENPGVTAGTLVEANRPLDNLGLDIFSASNNWAVSPSKSVYNKAIFANDMHLSFNVPGIWMQIHQVVEGEVNVTGVSLPGQPFVIVGHNEDVAWGMTNTYVDNLDLYEEKLSSDSSRYLYMDEWHPVRKKEEVIHIKGGDSTIRTNYFTHRGPIVSGFKNMNEKVVSMHWTGDEESNELRTVYLLNRAENWDDFKHAIKSFVAISQNINYADVEGNIGIYAAAGIPIRKRTEGLMILPGWTDEYDWKGLVPFEELPHEYNPPKGFVASANNKTIDNTYPYHIGKWYSLPHRFNRIEELLTVHGRLTVENFKQIQTDNYSKLAEELMPGILSGLDELSGSMNDAEATATQYLMQWDNFMEAGSPAPLIFEMIYHEIIKEVFKDELDTLYTDFIAHSNFPRAALHDIWDYDSTWWDDISTPELREGKYDIIKRAFRQVVKGLINELGDDVNEWRWMDMHKLTLSHPLSQVKALDIAFSLNKNDLPADGSFHTVAPFGYRFTDLFNVTHGASQRHIYLVGDWDKSFSVIPTGTSGNPGSNHYLDQKELYMTDQYHHDWFSKEKVIENARYKAVYKRE
ncbi:MAG: penicillin acylase family protein [Bacteroidota bacterium]